MVGLVTAAAIALFGFGVGCSTTKDNIPGLTTTDYYGTYSEQSGKFGTLQLQGISVSASTMGANLIPSPAELISLTGTLTLAGQAINLVGTFDSESGLLTFTSGDQSYQFSGTVLGGQATGLGFGPGGQGAFVLFVGGTSSTVPTFCGPAVCTSGCTETGSFSLATSGSVALLTAYYGGIAALAVGTVTGADVYFNVTQGGADVEIFGMISGSAVLGTWVDHNSGDSGTWDGTTAQCTAAP